MTGAFGLICLALVSTVTCSPETDNRKQYQDALQLLQNFLKTDEFDSIVTSKSMDVVKKIADCIERKGKNAAYDMDRRTCFECTPTKCAGNTVCTAQCTDKLRLSALEVESEEKSDQITDLNKKFAISTSVGGFALLLVIILIVLLLGYWYKSKYDHRPPPEFDAISQKEDEEHHNEEAPMQLGQRRESHVFVDQDQNDENQLSINMRDV